MAEPVTIRKYLNTRGRNIAGRVVRITRGDETYTVRIVQVFHEEIEVTPLTHKQTAPTRFDMNCLIEPAHGFSDTILESVA